MIAAGYSMDVYCGHEQLCKGKTVNGPAQDHFYGQSWTEVVREARANGWSIKRDKVGGGVYEAFCPWCNGKKIRGN